MLIVTKRRYKKQHVIGGAGIFDTLGNIFKQLIRSDAAKQLTSTALSASKEAAKENAKKVISVGKTTAIDVGKRLVDKAAAKLLAHKKPQIIPQLTPLQTQPTVMPTPLTQESKDALTKLINDDANINNILMGSGNVGPRKRHRATKSSAISIQDLVRGLNGGGMKMATI